jgi:alpha-glucosidase (family GH31 glycosyl hydrolase)
MKSAYNNIICLIIILYVSSCSALRRSNPSNAAAPDPVADPKAVVVVGNARFTVLTGRMIRAEWAADKVFEDRATFAVVNRRLPVPKFTLTNASGAVTITTDYLTLVYTNNNGSPAFSPTNLAITLLGVDGIKTTWNPSMNSTGSTGNLLGTIRTLDGVDGSIELDCVKQSRTDDLHCTYGLVSTSGWAVFDETNRPAFDNLQDPQWKWFVSRTANKTDWYFLGHGQNFEQALTDYTSIGGNLPLPPRFTFGIWWSRYWAYSDIEFMGIVNQYEMHQVPLDVLVIDMDWHITFYKEASQGQRDQAGQTPGWTGFTWDKQLFPNPDVFLAWVQSKGLQSTLNLHPASGVQPHEQRYTLMAQAVGIDPGTKKYVPFNLPNQTFAKTFHDIMLKPLETQGIDFWWLDWQQGENFLNIPGINPTFLLNYVFFTNPSAWSNGKRPLLFHRWGGLGNHRYQIGFTGDVVPSWNSLNFQVYFTATAANVGYGFWSHDIGGHTQPSPAELYTRWIQWGCFAPVLRTHCTKSPVNERRIWAYPLANFFIMRDAMVLRASLLPYTYTAARIAHDTGIAMLRGLYYSWPTHAEAYSTKTEYIFGDDMVVMPVTAPLNTATALVQQSVWIPPGQWIEWFSGLAFTGPKTVVRQFALDDIPVYVRAGSIIPMESPKDRTQLVGGSQKLPTTLTFVVFVSPSVTSGETNVYEDEGNTNVYDDNQHGAWTKATYSLTGASEVTVVVSPVDGTFPGLPANRNYKIVLNNVYNPQQVIVMGPHSYSYNGDMLALEITIDQVPVHTGVKVTVTFAQKLDSALLMGLPLSFRRMTTVKALIDNQWGASVWQEDYEHVILAASAGQRMSYSPTTAPTEIAQYPALYTTALNEVQAMTSLSPNIKTQVVALLTSAQPGGKDAQHMESVAWQESERAIHIV